jgi:transcription elongation factor B subunit 1
MAVEDTNSVVLISNDGFRFVVRKSAAMSSPAIKSMLDKRSMPDTPHPLVKK